MDQTIWNVLSLSPEPAVLVRGEELVFANREAKRLLGEDCTGAPAAELLGLPPGALPSGEALTATSRWGEELTLRMRPLGDALLIFFERRSDLPGLVNEALLYTLRANLQTLETAAGSLRPALEDEGRAALLEPLASLTRSLCALTRLTENAALAHSLETQDAPFAPEKLDLSLLLHAALDAAEEHLPALRITRQIQPGLILVGDAGLLRQLLFNLLSNALIHGEARQIAVSLRSTPQFLLLVVADDGKGIPEGELETAFNGYRAAADLTKLQKGAGLGLSAARAVAQLHGGTLLLESAVGRGTAVRVSLSRSLEAGTLFCVGQRRAVAEHCTMRELQLGLTDSLPLDAFREQYMD